jgi:hypothetical protein
MMSPVSCCTCFASVTVDTLRYCFLLAGVQSSSQTAAGNPATFADENATPAAPSPSDSGGVSAFQAAHATSVLCLRRVALTLFFS